MGWFRSIGIDAEWKGRFGTGVLLVAGALVAVATLTPLAGSGGGGGGLCIVCGELWLADLAANVLLFLPLGVGLGIRGLGGWAALRFGALLSLGIELAQVGLVTGRDANVMDIVSNSLGALLGTWVARSWAGWTAPSARRAGRLLTVATGCVLAITAATGVLLAPWVPPALYHAHWTDSPAGLEPYRGRVLQAAVGPVPVAGGQQEVPDSVLELLSRGTPLRLRFEAGPPTSRLSQLLVIENGPRDVVFLGPHGEDLVLRYGSRAGGIGLHQPTVRLREALRGAAPGDTVAAEVWRERRGFCLAVDSRTACATYSLGSAWALLQQSDFYPPWAQALLSLTAVLVLAFPLGLWLRRSRASLLLVAAALGGFVLVPLFVGLRSTSATELLAVAAGLALGMVVRRAAAVGSRRHRTPSVAAPPVTASPVESEVV